MSYLFTGASERIRFNSPPANWPTQVTVVAWIKPTEFVTRSTILIGYTAAGGELHGVSGRPGNKLAYEASWSGGIGRWVSPTDSLTLNAWQGIAATYDGSSTANTPALYIKPEGGAITAQTLTVEGTPTGTFEAAIPDGLWAGGVFVSYPFPGRLAYVRFFGSILSESEIDAEMSALEAIATAMGDWPFVTDADDRSGNLRNGTLLGDVVLDGDNPTLGSSAPSPFPLLSDEPMDDIRQKGATNQSVEVFFRDGTTGAPKTDLTYSSAGLGISYFRPGAAASAITLADLSSLSAAHAPGGFEEIGGGWYRLDLPDAVCATGVDRVRLFGSAMGAVMTPLAVTLVDYDPIAVGEFSTEQPELTSAPPVDNASPIDMLRWVYHYVRNAHVTTATTDTVKRNDESANLATATLSDSDDTFTRGEYT